jgi:hypothetical protein
VVITPGVEDEAAALALVLRHVKLTEEEVALVTVEVWRGGDPLA